MSCVYAQAIEKTEMSQNSASFQNAVKSPQKKDYPNIDSYSNEENSTTNAQEKSFPVLFSFLWVSLFLLAIAVSLAGQTIISYQPYALSEFNAHSMLSVIGTVQYILYVQLLQFILKSNAYRPDMQLLSPPWQEQRIYGGYLKRSAYR